MMDKEDLTPEQAKAYAKAYSDLAEAVQNYFEAARPNLSNLYVHDWTLMIAGESLDDTNTTYMSRASRSGISSYTVMGLLESAMELAKKNLFHG